MISNIRILLIIEKCQAEHFGDVLWGHKSGNKSTMVKKNRKGRTRKIRKNHTPFKESVQEKRQSLAKNVYNPQSF